VAREEYLFSRGPSSDPKGVDVRRRPFRFALVLASALPAFAVVSAANADRPGWPIPGTPKIVGTAQVGATVTGDVGSIYCDPRCTYALWEWLSCACPSAGGADVPSAPAGEATARAAGCRVAWPFPALSTYVVGPEDQGRYIQYHVIAENAECDEEGDCTTADAHGYSPTLGPVAAAPVTPVALPRNTSPPSITGLAEDMQTLTASPGTWTATAALAYQWQRCATTVESCRAIAGATGLRYHVARADIGARLSVAVTASGIGGTATASTALTAPVGPARPRPGHGALSIGQLLPAD